MILYQRSLGGGQKKRGVMSIHVPVPAQRPMVTSVFSQGDGSDPEQQPHQNVPCKPRTCSYSTSPTSIQQCKKRIESSHSLPHRTRRVAKLEFHRHAQISSPKFYQPHPPPFRSRRMMQRQKLINLHLRDRCRVAFPALLCIFRSMARSCIGRCCPFRALRDTYGRSDLRIQYQSTGSP